MNNFFTIKNLLLMMAGALLIFAIRYLERTFATGSITEKSYVTIIGLLFLGIGIFVASRIIRSKTVVHYVEKEREILIQPNDLLTERECDILKGIAMGWSNKEIGAKLFVSENTVKKHINNIYLKLDVSRRTQAIARARELKILS